ncbi:MULTISPECIES: heme exporter protein CcmD [Comamonas]|uniref:Heme exporter protein D n=1 Tax=Comamonas thiooxydans TaxID=363952 RepID=A0A096EU99_9BURK|nr:MULTISPECIES: heme exporter protein CcmD [Comamonas]ACY32758.1 eme exporter protein D (CcmD) [Comamonas thiooxydans]KGG91789.1 eme exporter protein D (CcmD) [Comamonas thiooxydans]KGG95296.1 eme exporter protein D (CcmD) [Comamonas thiooxydans]KGH00376.1 eme exporter protein D (CcmD) [Comamonas thiooxydans]KGH07867.1 eme exporter protein D (CcmD) [Comamonas thiooxydans]
MQDHAFFIALAYGVSAMALGIELVSIFVRSRRLKAEAASGLEARENP